MSHDHHPYAAKLTPGNTYLRFVLFVALAFRLYGISFGLPHLFHQDEPIIVNHALAYAGGDFNPHFFKIPPLLSYLLFSVYGVYYAVMAVFYHMTRESFALLFFQDPSSFYFLGRFVFGAVFGTLSVYALYRISRKLFSESVAVIAASLFAVSFLHVRDSHYIYADVPMLLAILLCLNSLASYTLGRRARNLILSAVWAGVATAFKYIAAPVLLPVFIVLAAQAREDSRGLGRKCALVCAVFAGTVVAMNPFGVLDFSFFVRELRQQASAESSMPVLHHLTYSLAEGMGPGMLAAGLAGLPFLWRSSPSTRWLLSFPAIFYLVITAFSQPYERYAMPIIPFLCVSAAALANALWQKSRDGSVKGVLFFVLFLLMAFPSLEKDFYLDRLSARPDTRTAAADWIEAEVPAGTGVILDHPFFSPRLFQTPEQLREKAGRVAAGDPHAGQKEEKIRLMLVAQEGKKSYRVFYLNPERLSGTPFLLWSPLVEPDLSSVRQAGAEIYVRTRYPGEPDFFEKELSSRATLLKVFSPYRDGQKIWTEDPWANVALPFMGRELFSRTVPGPYLEIYKIVPE